MLELKGAEIDQGWSGAPVLDLDTDRVVGMISELRALQHNMLIGNRLSLASWYGHLSQHQARASQTRRTRTNPLRAWIEPTRFLDKWCPLYSHLKTIAEPHWLIVRFNRTTATGCVGTHMSDRHCNVTECDSGSCRWLIE